jgi:hypothetical protein
VDKINLGGKMKQRQVTNEAKAFSKWIKYNRQKFPDTSTGLFWLVELPAEDLD